MTEMTQSLTQENLDLLKALVEANPMTVREHLSGKRDEVDFALRDDAPALIAMAERCLRYEAAAKALIQHDDVFAASYDKASPTHLATYADAVRLTRQALKGETE